MLQKFKYLFLSLSVFLSFVLTAGPKIDSCMILLRTTKDPKQRALIHNSLGSYWRSNADSCIKYCLLALQGLSDQSPEKINCLTNLAYSYRSLGRNDSSYSAVSSALLLNKQIKGMEEDKRLSNYGNIHNILGLYYYALGTNKEAISNYLLSIDYFNKTKDEADSKLPLNNLAIFYAENGDLDKALEYFEEVSELNKKVKDLQGVIQTLVNIGAIYQRKDDNLKAIEVCNEALALVNDQTPKSISAMILGNIGVNYAAKKSYRKAIEYFNLSLEKWLLSGESYGIIGAKINLAETYLNNNDLDNALKFAKDASLNAREMKLNKVLMDSYKIIGEIYVEKKDYEQAYWSRTKVDSLLEITNSENNAAAIAEMRTKFDTEKKEQDNKLLAIQNATSQNEIRQHKTFNFIITIALLITIVLVYFVVTGLKKQKKANKIIEEQKKEVEEKQKEVMDSIRYAQRIQKAHLPSENFITRKLLNLKNKE